MGVCVGKVDVRGVPCSWFFGSALSCAGRGDPLVVASPVGGRCVQIFCSLKGQGEDFETRGFRGEIREWRCDAEKKRM